MAGYFRVFSRFWTGETGRTIRSLGRDAQVVALYLMTCPNANDLGLYYLPLPTLCHETGIRTSEGASKALRRLSEVGFAHYDAPSETVYVVEMAAYQIGDALKEGDNRRKWICEEARNLRKHPHFPQWYARYQAAFMLPEIEGLPSPFEAPPEPLRSQTPTQTPIQTTNPKEKAGNATPPSGDEEWLDELKANPAYVHVDWPRELGKMDAWLRAHPGRQKTRKFIVNWLNKVDAPVKTEGVAVDPMRAAIEEGMREALADAAERRADGLRLVRQTA